MWGFRLTDRFGVYYESDAEYETDEDARDAGIGKLWQVTENDGDGFPGYDLETFNQTDQE